MSFQLLFSDYFTLNLKYCMKDLKALSSSEIFQLFLNLGSDSGLNVLKTYAGLTLNLFFFF